MSTLIDIISSPEKIVILLAGTVYIAAGVLSIVCAFLGKPR